jgi:predicted DNA-binding transcriptional regulator AlpA
MRFSEKTKEEAVAFLETHTLAQTAEKYGISRNTAWVWKQAKDKQPFKGTIDPAELAKYLKFSCPIINKAAQYFGVSNPTIYKILKTPEFKAAKESLQ